MPSKNSLWDFIMSQTFISVLALGVGMFNILFAFLSRNPNIAGLIALIVLMFLAFERWSLEQNLNLIKEYKSLMTSLKGLVNPTDDICIWEVVSYSKNKEGLPHCWQYYFNEKGIDLNNKFNELNFELDKLISTPYLLMVKSRCHISGRTPKKQKQDLSRQSRTYFILQKFAYLVMAYQDQYKKFEEMLDTVNIDKNSFNYGKIKKAKEEFNSALKLSKFEEIRKLSE